MKTLVLPGFSPHNCEWAGEIKTKVKLGHPVEVINWEHWKTGGGLKLRLEREKIIKAVGNERVNIIAKSVGTRVTAKLLSLIDDRVEKIILCGVPSVGHVMKELFREAFKNFPAERVICFQNAGDPFASYDSVVVFFGYVNKGIKIVRGERNDHNYPYFADFSAFLS